MNGVDLIRMEREAQILTRGYSPEHDAAHTGYELSKASVAFLYWSMGYKRAARQEYPWLNPPKGWDGQGEEHDRIRDLVVAGALIAAEIDRLLRSQKSTKEAA